MREIWRGRARRWDEKRNNKVRLLCVCVIYDKHWRKLLCHIIEQFLYIIKTILNKQRKSVYDDDGSGGGDVAKARMAMSTHCHCYGMQNSNWANNNSLMRSHGHKTNEVIAKCLPFIFIKEAKKKWNFFFRPIFTVKSSALYKSCRYFSPKKGEQQTEWKHAHFICFSVEAPLRNPREKRDHIYGTEIRGRWAHTHTHTWHQQRQQQLKPQTHWRTNISSTQKHCCVACMCACVGGLIPVSDIRRICEHENVLKKKCEWEMNEIIYLCISWQRDFFAGAPNNQFAFFSLFHFTSRSIFRCGGLALLLLLPPFAATI